MPRTIFGIDWLGGACFAALGLTGGWLDGKLQEVKLGSQVRRYKHIYLAYDLIGFFLDWCS
jgi:hypothetical protein